MRKVACLLYFLSISTVALSKDHFVTSSQELASAAKVAAPGDTIIVSGGPYSGMHLAGLRGSEKEPITIRGKSITEPGLFKGGNTGLHLSASRFVTLRFLNVTGAKINGVNIDDGGDKKTPARGIVVEDCEITNTGPKGNTDALKMSGVDEFIVRRCKFVGWGGSGIDMVGCHDGVVENCFFEGKDGFSQANAVQMKGGSARILVQANFFKEVGHRALNIGGSTGLPYFRPAVGKHEATDIEVAGNRFVGSMAPIAWVTCKGGHVHHNTIYKPGKWVARILQENTGEIFEPAAEGLFENNLIIFDQNVRTFINVGSGTAPDTFVFRSNAWFEPGEGNRSLKPALPTNEKDGIYGVDPELINAGTEEMEIGSPSPALKGIGADYYQKKQR